MSGETYGWHYGFNLATIGMLVGLFIFIFPPWLNMITIGGGALSVAFGLFYIANTTPQLSHQRTYRRSSSDRGKHRSCRPQTGGPARMGGIATGRGQSQRRLSGGPHLSGSGRVRPGDRLAPPGRQDGRICALALRCRRYSVFSLPSLHPSAGSARSTLSGLRSAVLLNALLGIL